ncbi:MAG: glycosyltransferase [Aquihabitans sp.]
MTGPEHPEGAEELRAALAAERAGAEHWRRLARQREAALAEVKSRTSVRAVLSLDRRTAPFRDRVRDCFDRSIDRLDQVRLATRALGVTPSRSSRQVSLDTLIRHLPSIAPDPRPKLLIVIGASGGRARTIPDGGDATRVEMAATVGDVAAKTKGQLEEIIVLVAATTEPLTNDWIHRLTAPILGSVVATTGVLIHPGRPTTNATEDDLLVWSAGLSATVDADGTPGLRAAHSGQAVADAADGPVVATTAGWLAIDRRAFHAAGGLIDLGGLPGLDASFIDLCVRLRSPDAHDAPLRCVADALAFDHRRVLNRDQLNKPVASSGHAWRSLVARTGPALVRASADWRTSPKPASLRLAITVASPSAKVAHQWGDWHLAEALARSLRTHGHEATVQTLADVDSSASRSHDVQLVVRGLGRVERTPGQHHVLWVISHPEDLDGSECDAADLVLVASERFAAHLRTRTSTPVEVMLQASDTERFRPLPVDPRHHHPVTVVAKSRDVLRPAVRDAVAVGLRPAIYGSGWEGLVDPELIVTQHVENHELASVYASADVVLNDHWDTMRTWGFVSNRIFDVLACGTPVVSDYLPEIGDLFGDLVPTWQTPQELSDAVAELSRHSAHRSSRGSQARDLIVRCHSFDQRASELILALERHGLTPPT